MNTQTKVSPYVFPLLSNITQIDVVNDKSKRDQKAGEYIISKTLSYFGCTEGDMQGESRLRRFVECRQMICYLLRKETNLSLKQIARRIGDRDHSTVIYSVKNMTALLETDQEFKRKYKEIMEKL